MVFVTSWLALLLLLLVVCGGVAGRSHGSNHVSWDGAAQSCTVDRLNRRNNSQVGRRHRAPRPRCQVTSLSPACVIIRPHRQHAMLDAACCYRCHTDVCVFVCWHTDGMRKNAKLIEMLFGGQTGVRPVSHVLDEDWDLLGEWTLSWGT